jgi:hypothetical protein
LAFLINFSGDVVPSRSDASVCRCNSTIGFLMHMDTDFELGLKVFNLETKQKCYE